MQQLVEVNTGFEANTGRIASTLFLVVQAQQLFIKGAGFGRWIETKFQAKDAGIALVLAQGGAELTDLDIQAD